MADPILDLNSGSCSVYFCASDAVLQSVPVHFSGTSTGKIPVYYTGITGIIYRYRYQYGLDPSLLVLERCVSSSSFMWVSVSKPADCGKVLKNVIQCVLGVISVCTRWLKPEHSNMNFRP
jgi:hypothetical protein